MGSLTQNASTLVPLLLILAGVFGLIAAGLGVYSRKSRSRAATSDPNVAVVSNPELVDGQAVDQESPVDAGFAVQPVPATGVHDGSQSGHGVRNVDGEFAVDSEGDVQPLAGPDDPTEPILIIDPAQPASRVFAMSGPIALPGTGEEIADSAEVVADVNDLAVINSAPDRDLDPDLKNTGVTEAQPSQGPAADEDAGQVEKVQDVTSVPEGDALQVAASTAVLPAEVDSSSTAAPARVPGQKWTPKPKDSGGKYRRSDTPNSVDAATDLLDADPKVASPGEVVHGEADPGQDSSATQSGEFPQSGASAQGDTGSFLSRRASARAERKAARDAAEAEKRRKKDEEEAQRRRRKEEEERARQDAQLREAVAKQVRKNVKSGIDDAMAEATAEAVQDAASTAAMAAAEQALAVSAEASRAAAASAAEAAARDAAATAAAAAAAEAIRLAAPATAPVAAPVAAPVSAPVVIPAPPQPLDMQYPAAQPPSTHPVAPPAPTEPVAAETQQQPVARTAEAPPPTVIVPTVNIDPQVTAQAIKEAAREAATAAAQEAARAATQAARDVTEQTFNPTPSPTASVPPIVVVSSPDELASALSQHGVDPDSQLGRSVMDKAAPVNRRDPSPVRAAQPVQADVPMYGDDAPTPPPRVVVDFDPASLRDTPGKPRPQDATPLPGATPATMSSEDRRVRQEQRRRAAAERQLDFRDRSASSYSLPEGASVEELSESAQATRAEISKLAAAATGDEESVQARELRRRQREASRQAGLHAASASPSRGLSSEFELDFVAWELPEDLPPRAFA